MWTREELKTRGKAAFLRNYWICVVAALILTLLVGSGTSNSGNSNNGNQHNTSSISGFTISSDNLNVASFAERFTPLGPVKFVFSVFGGIVLLSSDLHLFSSTFLSWLPSKSEAQGFSSKTQWKKRDLAICCLDSRMAPTEKQSGLCF